MHLHLQPETLTCRGGNPTFELINYLLLDVHFIHIKPLNVYRCSLTMGQKNEALNKPPDTYKAGNRPTAVSLLCIQILLREAKESELLREPVLDDERSEPFTF